MYKFKNYLIALAGLLAIVGVIALVTPQTIHSQTGSVGLVKPMLVVNSPSEPVPVTGTVNVGNLGNGPLVVRDVNEPGGSPYQESKSFPIRTYIDTAFVPFTIVPANKRLVIKRVSAELEMNVGVKIRELVLKVGTVRHHFNCVFVGRFSIPISPGAIDLYRVNEELLAYADEGTTPEVLVKTDEGSGQTGYIHSVTLSGYFVAVP